MLDDSSVSSSVETPAFPVTAPRIGSGEPRAAPDVAYCHRGGDLPLIGVPIHTYLEGVAARHPDRDALVSIPQNLRLTYAELFAQVDRLAKGLIALGVAKGERVGIWAVNNVEWLVLQLATAKVGAVLVNINPAAKPHDLRHAIQSVGVRTLFLMPAFRKSHYAEMVEGLDREQVPSLSECVLFDPYGQGAELRDPETFMPWGDVLARGESVSDDALLERASQLRSDDPINVQFTSGTTGVPKPVVLTHHNILNNGYACAAELGMTPEDRLCVPLPFYHCFGMVVSNLGCLTHGAAIVIASEHFDAEAVLRAVQQEKCTVLHGVPTMFVAIFEVAEFADYDTSSLRTGIMAGAPCPPELMRRVIDVLGAREIRIGYGQTEAAPVTHMTHADDSFERRVDTVGTNLPYQESRVANPESGATVPIGVQGEICVRGYNVMRGYHGMPDATAAAIDRSGWLHTGDLGVMDADGYMRITGRLKDMIIRGGENVYPAEVEAYLDEHPRVAQAAVFGIPHEKLGEEIAVWIEPHEGEELTVEELVAFAKEGLAHFKVPRIVRIVDAFPLTVTGKIQKFRMRDTEVARMASRSA